MPRDDHLPTERTPSPARRVGRSVVRGAGVATAFARSWPDFLVIGAKRSGTTALYFALLDHPQVLPMFPPATHLPMTSHMKGAHYFDTQFGKGPSWYRSHFPLHVTRRLAERRVGGPVRCGEASPYYLFHPRAAERASRLVPDVRLVAMLRNPVDRAFSHWKEQRRRGQEPAPTFRAAVDAEPARLAGEAERLAADDRYRSFAHEHQSYVAQGEYVTGLRRWADRYPASRLLVVRSEDFFADPEARYGEVLAFLGLPPHPLADPSPRNTTERAEVATDLRARLVDHFAPHNAALERFLGRSFDWDR